MLISIVNFKNIILIYFKIKNILKYSLYYIFKRARHHRNHQDF
jgi:hypothetical protein